MKGSGACLAVWLAAMAAGGGADAPPGPAPGAGGGVEARPEGDARAEVAQGDGVATVEVRSPGGIGRMRLAPGPGGWPERIVLRLHLATLEGITFRQGDLVIQGGIQSYAPHRVHGERRRGGQPEPGEPLEIRPVGPDGQPATVPLEGGFIEVAVPRALLLEPDPVQVLWIDAYRT